MKKVFLIYIYIILSSILYASKLDSLFQQANTFYAKGDYQKAIKLYDSIIKKGYVSPYLYYNLGNAYYKLGKFGYAILNYEKGLLYTPYDENLRYNLELAKAHTIDKIEEIPEFFLKKWYRSFVNLVPSNTWAIISLSFFILFITCIIFLITYETKIKTLLFNIAILSIIFSIISFINAGKRKNFITAKKYAIIVVPSVNVKSTPNEYGNDVFILHEGTKVEIIESIGNWKNIKISDGNEGYLPLNTIEIIE